jgi:hypothetical protein
MLSGAYPGNGKPKPVCFPQPGKDSEMIDGLRTVTLEKLIELKLASGLTNAGRLKDLADVQELIRIRKLPPEFAERLHPFVRHKFTELHQGLRQSFSPDDAK